MPGFFTSKNKRSQVGVDFMPTGVAAVEVGIAKKDRGLVKRSDFLPSVGSSEQVKVLQQWVTENKLLNANCTSLIAKHDVQLFQLEKPAVADEQLLQAVSWKINDLINYDVETAVVDVFQLPPSPKSPVNYINAVVANEVTVGGYVESIKQTGLSLQVIDVHDLVTKNYCRVCGIEDSTVAVLQFSDNEGLVTIYHHQDLYVARDFKIGLMDIDAALNEDEAIYDSLLLELQRSMDYFESTYGLGMVQKMVIFPQTPGTVRMAKYVQNYVSYELDFVEVNVAGDGQQEALDKHCFPAYCAALRGIQL
ncbi:MAG: hypothetical protein HOK37_14270 [Gammaproteobacteria bacterium]|nr:hypothetical protein [Gammaproteobacteria bacterium]